MEIAWQNVALAMAGIIGACVAVLHGIRVQRFMVGPFEEFALADKRIAERTRRLVPLLLHFSTIAWFLGGPVLVAAANGFQQDARLASSLFVGSTYLFGAVVNLWATRGPHPGWMLMAAALVLILLGANKPGVFPDAWERPDDDTHPALVRWYDYVKTKDRAMLWDALHPDAVFESPVVQATADKSAQSTRCLRRQIPVGSYQRTCARAAIELSGCDARQTITDNSGLGWPTAY